MDFQQQQQQQLVGTKKRRHMPQELFGRFSSKADFIRYFKETSKQTQSFYDHTCSVQLYVPPEYMINKDFLKEVFAEEKALLELKEVKWINVPLFDELSVINIWPMTE